MTKLEIVKNNSNPEWNEGIEIEGTVKVYYGKSQEKINFKAVYEWGSMGDGLSSYKIIEPYEAPEKYVDVFLSFGDELRKFMKKYLNQFDLR